MHFEVVQSGSAIQALAMHTWQLCFTFQKLAEIIGEHNFPLVILILETEGRGLLRITRLVMLIISANSWLDSEAQTQKIWDSCEDDFRCNFRVLHVCALRYTCIQIPTFMQKNVYTPTHRTHTHTQRQTDRHIHTWKMGENIKQACILIRIIFYTIYDRVFWYFLLFISFLKNCQFDVFYTRFLSMWKPAFS